MTSSSAINDVSDTALWVATFRALESERPDAAFRDTLAKTLVGERGRKIAGSMPYASIMAWIMTMRTVSIDRLVVQAVAGGVDTVLNLGAGLDTRPYRLDLPAALRWVEADFPHIVRLKNETLRAETPRCRLERIALDLSNAAARRALLQDVSTDARKVLVITEGVIPYLRNEEAAALADDLAAAPHFWGWIQDYNNDLARRRAPRSWRRKMVSAPFRFTAPDWFQFFAEHGWTMRESILAVDEAKRLGRPFPFIFPWSLLLNLMPKTREAIFRRMSGCALFTRT